MARPKVSHLTATKNIEVRQRCFGLWNHVSISRSRKKVQAEWIHRFKLVWRHRWEKIYCRLYIRIMRFTGVLVFKEGTRDCTLLMWGKIYSCITLCMLSCLVRESDWWNWSWEKWSSDSENWQHLNNKLSQKSYSMGEVSTLKWNFTI